MTKTKAVLVATGYAVLVATPILMVVCLLARLTIVTRTRSYELTALESPGNDPECGIKDGYMTVWPWEDLYVLDGRSRELGISTGRSSAGLPGVDCLSRDGALFTVVITVEYRLSDAAKVFERFGLGQEEELRPKIESSITTEVSAAMQALAQLYTLEHMLAKRHEMRDNAMVLLGFERRWQRGPVRVRSDGGEGSETNGQAKPKWEEITLEEPGSNGSFDPQLKKLREIGIDIASFRIDFQLRPEIEASFDRRSVALSEISAVAAEEAKVVAESSKISEEANQQRIMASAELEITLEELNGMKDPGMLRAYA
ncbi:MAG: hypothetical protein GY854_12970, partial [Deltaproteobacteria bacterium]|nr:hypothetical protein [Deltaproteobacteria bacterium]